MSVDDLFPEDEVECDHPIMELFVQEDVFNNALKVLERMGFSREDLERATQVLDSPPPPNGTV